MSKKRAAKKKSISSKKSSSAAPRKSPGALASKRPAKTSVAAASSPQANAVTGHSDSLNGVATGAELLASNEPASQLFPARGDLAMLYQRYTNGAKFDEHDKAFYFVLDVGGINRARQLIDHVAEVLAEMEEFQ